MSEEESEPRAPVESCLRSPPTSPRKSKSKSLRKKTSFQITSPPRSKWHRRLNDFKWIYLATILQSISSNALVSASISTIERQFGLSSRDTGFMKMAYAGGFVVMSVLLIFLRGRKTEKESDLKKRSRMIKWIFAGCLLVGLGDIIFAIPQFVSNGQEQVSHAESFCTVGMSNTTSVVTDLPAANSCNDKHDITLPMTLFLLGDALIGMGSAPMFTVSPVFIDNYVLNEDESHLYCGLLAIAHALAPAIGFGIASGFLVLPANLKKQNGGHDPNFVGAWWLSFLVVGGLSIFAAIFICLMLKRRKRLNITRSATTLTADVSNISLKVMDRLLYSDALESEKKPMREIWHLFKNSTYRCLLVRAILWHIMTAIQPFLAKYVQSVFKMQSGTAAALMIVWYVAAGVGVGFDVLLHMRHPENVKSMLKRSTQWYCAATALSFGLLLHCYTPVVFNSDENYCGIKANCNCSNEVFSPVCWEEKSITFLSHCHAGCRNESLCTCPDESDPETFVPKQGVCQGNQACYVPILVVFAFFFALHNFFLNITQNSLQQVNLRCVSEQQHILALSVSMILARVLGSLPTPPIAGVLINKLCKKWKFQCGQMKSCNAYDENLFAYSIFAGHLSLSLAMTFCTALAWRSYSHRDVSKSESSPEKAQSTVQEPDLLANLNNDDDDDDNVID